MNTTSNANPKLARTLAVTLAMLLVLSLAGSPTGTGAIGSMPQTGAEPATVIARAQGTTGEDVPLDGPDAWVQASVTIDGAPQEAVVSAVQIKYHVAQAAPGDLRVQLRTSGARTSHVLWDRQGGEGQALAQATAKIDAFQGAPVNGAWSLAVQGGSAEGYVDDFGIIVYYETEMPILQSGGEGDPGAPAFLSLPKGAAPAGPNRDEDEKPSGEGSPVVPQTVPSGATIIHTQNFQGTFPAGAWRLLDNSNDGQTRYWDDASCDECGGDWAAWPADGGANRVNVCGGDTYPDNMFTWMIYGPFSLSGATDAGTDFTMWRQIEVDYDFVFFGVSHNGTDFTGIFWDGNANCTRHNITGFGEWLGDSSVWVAWVFGSDASVRYIGPWVDDIVIWKTVDNPPANLVCLPLVSAPLYAPPCHASNNHCEPYNACQNAYGPLAPNTIYRAYPNDTEDYYYFELATGASVKVSVKDYAPTSDNGTVMLSGPASGNRCGPDIDYYGPRGHTSMSLGPYWLAPGRYHVRVYTEQSHSTSERYSLEVKH